MVKEDESSAGAFPLGLVGLPLVGLQLKVICGSRVGHCYLLVSSIACGQVRIEQEMFTHFTLSQCVCDDLWLSTSYEPLCSLLKSEMSFMRLISTHTLCQMLLHLMRPKAHKTEEDAQGIAHTMFICSLPPERSPLIVP